MWTEGKSRSVSALPAAVWRRHSSVLRQYPAETRVQVDDAYAECSADGQHCAIGTAAVRLAFAGDDGHFRLVSYQNLLVDPAREYVDPDRPPLRSRWKRRCRRKDGSSSSRSGKSSCRTRRSSIRPRIRLALDVRKDELIGFSVGPHGDFSGDETDWITTVDYGDGERYTSSQDTQLEQGPIWYYYVHRPRHRPARTDRCRGDVGVLRGARADSQRGESLAVAGQHAACRSHQTASLAGRGCGARVACTAGWQGDDSRRGAALQGLRRYRRARCSASARNRPAMSLRRPWRLPGRASRPRSVQVVTGGRPAVQLNVTLQTSAVAARLHILAYPHTPVLRQWVELENTGSELVSLQSPTPLAFDVARRRRGPAATVLADRRQQRSDARSAGTPGRRRLVSPGDRRPDDRRVHSLDGRAAQGRSPATVRLLPWSTSVVGDWRWSTLSKGR